MIENSGIVSILTQVKEFIEREVASKVQFQAFTPTPLVDLYTDIDKTAQGMNWAYRIDIAHPVVKLMTYAYEQYPDMPQPQPGMSEEEREALIQWASQSHKTLSQSAQVIVRFTNAQTRMVPGTTQTDVNIQLEVICWNDGFHLNEVYYPTGQKAPEPDKGKINTSGLFETTHDVGYVETGDGWADVLHLATMIRTALMDCDEIIASNLRFNEDEGIEISPLGDAQGIWNTDPFFIVHMDFSVTSYESNRRNDIREGL